MSERPFLQVVHGALTPEEIAALVTALTTRAAPAPPERRRSPWSDPSRLMRRPLPHGPGAWRSAM